MWIKSIAKREANDFWSVRTLARNFSSLSKVINMKDKEDDENDDTDTAEEEVKAEGDDTDTEESDDTDAEEEKVEAEEVRDAEAIHDVTYICSLMFILCGISTYNTYDIMRRVWAKTISYAQKLQEYNNEDELKINMPRATPVDIDIDDLSNMIGVKGCMW